MIEGDLLRVAMINYDKKLHANSQVSTTHFLKKCAMQGSDGVFTRGALTFEDYNYAQANPYILIESSEQRFQVPLAQRLDENVLDKVQNFKF